jgi:hypothetical protein
MNRLASPTIRFSGERGKLLKENPRRRRPRPRRKKFKPLLSAPEPVVELSRISRKGLRMCASQRFFLFWNDPTIDAEVMRYQYEDRGCDRYGFGLSRQSAALKHKRPDHALQDRNQIAWIARIIVHSFGDIADLAEFAA